MRTPRFAAVTTLLLAASGIAAPMSAVEAATGTPAVTGRVMGLVAGDTLLVRTGGKTETVRLIGVDTPDVSTKQCWSAQAKEFSRALVGGQVVTVRRDSRQKDRDELGRLMRHVQLSDGSSLGQRLLVNGQAREKLTGRGYAGRPTFLDAQSVAKAKKRGLWRACPTTAPATRTPGKAPAAKKSSKKVTTPKRRPVPAPTGRCDIKGNISDSGERIYHMPGQRYYKDTKIDLRRGERWFCSPASAERAGWRPAAV